MVDKSKLSKPALKALQDYDALLFVSVVSFWEIAIKHGKGRLDLVNFQLQHIPEYCRKLGVQQLPLILEDAISYSNLPFAEEHKDPFDRMLICQSIRGGYTLVSRDDKMKSYEKDGLRCIW